MLSPYRVLDLTDERGQLAGAILAGLGADVVLVEPPGGSPSRRLGPWAGGEPGPERSLTHWGYNRGKRSVELDVASSDEDLAALRRLVEGADVLIESGGPALEALRAEPRTLNPALVHVTVSAFGSDGPKADWAATELTVWASSMALALTGDADRAPVRVTVPQAFMHAGAEAAVGALLALHERARSGRGQHVDVSAQQASLQATQSMVLAAPLRSSVPTRTAGGVRLGPLNVRLSWPCRDGYVAITFLFGSALAPPTKRLMDWICEEGFCDEATRDKNWVDYAVLLFTGGEPLEEYERVKQVVETFTLTKTKDELLQGAIERRLLIAPVTTIPDVVASEQLAARGYWDEVADGDLSSGPIVAPGRIAVASRTPLKVLGRASRLGEHTAAVTAEPRREPAALPAQPGPADRLPLDGVKVLDFMWVMAGPAMSRVLADFGATVVRIESSTRVETGRTLNPFLDDVTDIERSGLYWNLNAGKLGLALNLAKPGAMDVAHDLVRWADVVTESYSPRAMRAWGLDYERLREVNPSILMLSSCLMGQTGPLAEFAGYGNLAAAIAGFFNITGWPDRAPAGPFGAYTDYISPRFGLAVLLAALDHRRRTGEGQYIDLSQAEAAMHVLTPALLDWSVNGHVTERHGNDDAHMSPHGVYASAGEDQWVAVACASDEQWRSLCTLIGRTDLAQETLAARRSRSGEIDKLIESWTSSVSPDEAAQRLQDAGVPAHAVVSSAEASADPQLVARGHFVEVGHPSFGPVTLEGPRVRLDRTPGHVERPGPTLGEHTMKVLGELLGYDEDKIGDLFAQEVLE